VRLPRAPDESGRFVAALKTLTGDAELIDRLLARAERTPVDPFSLTPLERVSISIWCSPYTWHRKINNALDRIWLPPKPPAMIVAGLLQGAVAKLPRYKGLCFRGVTRGDVATRSRKARSPFQSGQYVAGNVVTWHRFNAASVIPERAFKADTLFVIDSLSGRSLQGYAVDDSEREVLFLPGSRFHVIRVQQDGDREVIVLAERE
jgi:NAD:arginine ADP-ribosyltransferase